MKDYASALAKLSPEKQALLALRLKKAQGEPARRQGIPRREAPDAPAPLSFAQERLWFLSQLGVGGAYNDRKAFALRGELDAAVLAASFDEIRRRHEVLRTVFRTVDDSPVQVVREWSPTGVPLVDLSALPPEERAAELARIGRWQGERSFDLAEESALRTTLARLAEREHVLFLTMHHIATDGWSWEVLLREVARLRTSFSRGERPALPALPIQYADFAAWQRRHLAEGALDEQLTWWTRELAESPHAMELPTDRPRPAQQSFEGAEMPFDLPADACEALRELCSQESATLFMGLLALYGVLLGRYAGQSDVLVGSPTAGRRWPETEPLIGVFINTLVMRVELAGDPTFRELLGRIRKWSLQAFDRQDVPFERLVDALGLPRDLSRSPLFQVLLAVQNTTRGGGLELGTGLDLEPYALSGASAKLDLEMAFLDQPGALAGSLEYNTGLFDRTTAARLLRGFRTLLGSAVAAPDRPLSRLSLLGEAERFQILREWNDTDWESGREATLHERFEAWADRTPDAPAVVAPGRELTYRELDVRANRLARHLADRGLGPGDFVGIQLDRSPEMAVALLGVLKCGAAYVPLDPAYPAARIEWILEALSIRCVVTRELMEEDLSHLPAGRLGRRADSGDLAYVIFTSGTTGTPKGVMVRHRPVINLIEWVNGTFGVGPGDRVLFVASLGFDLSVYDVFGLLAAGGSVRVATDEEVRDPERLVRILTEEPVTFWDSAPAALQQLVPLFPEEPAAAARLRLVFLSGDWIPLPLPDEVRRTFPGARVVSLGGATEATVWSNVFPVGEVDPAWPSIPYGRPIRNARYHVLDAALTPCPVLVPGDLYIGGECLAAGYIPDPELTATKFIPDPFSRSPGGRLYRTGDRARSKADGNLEFLGRLDQQVKIRGFRIELGEIESVLLAHAGVRAAVVLARRGAAGTRLVAYVVPEEGAELTVDRLREAVRERLPEYMVPAAWMLLAALPVTANGKLDRQALPEPAAEAAAEEAEAPRGPVEEELCRMFGELLGLPPVGIRDDFFALGGHSILATRLLARVRSAFGAEIPLRQIFQAPTVAELAAAIGPRGAPVRGLRPGPLSEGPFPVSFSQRRLWFVDRLEAGSPYFNIATAVRLDGPLDVARLGRALSEVARRHEALRTVFAEREGEPVQVVLPPAPVALPGVDLSALPGEAEARLRATEEARKPFDLARGPLLRALLLKLGKDRHALLLVVHHTVADWLSLGVLVREVTAA
ncbi:MAG TPA: amino acid adenylation domain-containing protein, partial [Thermoanaerobaculia bacterium]|nr:amino acid adenylation domain-containing protein [Thermoanaerobaculia bacterium]